MKFIELFNKDMSPNWDFIFGLKYFNMMQNTKQSKVWHQEGDVGEHTKLVTGYMEDYLTNKLSVSKSNKYYLIMMSAAICHDVGKVLCTKIDKTSGEPTSKGHEFQSGRIVRKLFYDEDLWTREKVCSLVSLHMSVHNISEDDKLYYRLMRLSNSYTTIEDLFILGYCDQRGSKTIYNEDKFLQSQEYAKEAAKRIGCFDKPYVFDNKKQKQLFFYPKSHISKNCNQSDFIIYVMFGHPGPWIDTWIKENHPELPVVSKDDERGTIALSDVQTIGANVQEEEPDKDNRKKMYELAKNHISFIIKDGNSSKNKRDDMHTLLSSYNPKYVYVYVEGTNIEDDNDGKDKNKLSYTTYKTLGKYNFPEPYEYDKLIIHRYKK